MRALSGIKPTGTLHLGNYIGAARQFHMMQEKQYEGFYFIADYHTLNAHPDPETLRKNSREIVLDYMAFGLDPEKSTLFLQSRVPEVVELAFILGNFTPMGLLQRAHSYKDKLAKGEAINTGLFYYPLLMTADILLYKSDVVPVGKDQKQHVEIARDIAEKFNLHYGVELFPLPEPMIQTDSAIVPGTDGRKMSKSYDNTIEMFAPNKALKKQVMGIVTDSTPMEDPKEPDGNTIFQIYSLMATPEEKSEMAANFRAGGYGYGHAKKELLNKIHEVFDPMREKRAELELRPDFVEDIIQTGSIQARKIAQKTLSEVRDVIGLPEM